MPIPGITASAHVVPSAPPLNTQSYLDSTVGYVTTPDIAIPYPCTYVLKLLSSTPASTTLMFLTGQTDGGAGDYGWRLSRPPTAGAINVAVSQDGSNGTWQNNAAYGAATGADEYLAFSMEPGSGFKVVPYISTDSGLTYVPGSPFTPWNTFTPWDSSQPIQVGGAISFPSAPWAGRIYSIECRSGLDPRGGTVIWRFDADDHVSGTSWTDPRGKTWTLSNSAAIVHPAPPYLFTENWNTADAANWDWMKWPHQRPYCTIVSNQGKITGSGGPTIVAADKYVTDFEMKVKMTWDAASPNYPEICWRLFDGLGGYSSSSGYIIQIKPNGQIDIYRIGAYSGLGTGGGLLDPAIASAGTWWFKVRVVGNNHKVKWWPDGSGEPGTWQLDANDSAPLTDTQGAPIVGGAIGFRNYGSPPNYFVDDLTITDLASPSLPVTDGSMRMLSNAKVIALNGSNAFASDTDLTWCGWVRHEGRSANAAAVWSLFSGGSTYCITSIAADGQVRQYNDTGDIASGYTVPLNTWVFIAMSRSISGGTDIYWAPAGTSTLSTVHNASKGTVAGLHMRVMSDEYGSNPYSMGCGLKCWAAALTKTELEAEMPFYAPQRTANLFLAHSFKDGMDYRADNDPTNSSKWLWYESGGIVSGPKAAHLT